MHGGDTIERTRAGLLKREYSSWELAKKYLACIEEKNNDVGAYLEVFDSVEEQAIRADKRIAKGEEGPLLGVPIAVKDNISMKGQYSTAGSKILEGYRAVYDATVITRIKAAGAVLLGRTNLDEFAMGSSTEHSAWGVTRNPHDPKRVPGGSSGGSATAVALGAALAALGSDTGGSIRQPASFCGVVGLKPTYGTVSRYGLIALGSSLDVIGPLANSVEDVELLYRVIAGRDPLDATSRDPRSRGSREDTSKVRIVGVPRDFLEEGMDSDVAEAFESMLRELGKKGYEVRDIKLPSVTYSLAVYYIVMPAEASSNLARFDGVKYGLLKEGETLLEDYTTTRGVGFGPEARRRILLGTYVLSSGYYDAYYRRANELRERIRKDFLKAFESVDVIVTPTTPTAAFLIGEKKDPLSMYLADIFTVPANLTGMPAMSVPMGSVTRDTVPLPIGFQILAPDCEEERLFALGKVIEDITQPTYV